MSTTSEEPTIHELLSRLAELEQAHACLQEELTNVRAERVPVAEEQTSTQTRPRPRRSSRRKVLRKGLGVAVATVGAGAMLELSSGTALAKPIGPGDFASSVSGTPAVRATGTNGADGVDASSDSGIGVKATSTSGTGLVATSSSGDGIHGSTSGSGAGVLAQTGTGAGLHAVIGGTPTSAPSTAVFAEGNAAFGVYATSVDNTAIFGDSTGNAPLINAIGVRGIGPSLGVAGSSISGVGVGGLSSFSDGVIGNSGSTTMSAAGVHGINRSGLAGLFDGNVQVNGNFSATGTKAFVQAHPTDPSREIVYVALEGGEAGTYVRGTGTLVNGKAVLALPEHFGLVTATEGLTIQFAPRGEWLQLYVVELDATQAVVREAQGKSGEFDYFICGVRKGYEQHEVLRTKR